MRKDHNPEYRVENGLTESESYVLALACMSIHLYQIKIATNEKDKIVMTIYVLMVLQYV